MVPNNLFYLESTPNDLLFYTVPNSDTDSKYYKEDFVNKEYLYPENKVKPVNKLESVDKLEHNIQGGSSKYYHKYLKYKQKYQNLKNKLNQSN
jgi:hypothetical protein